MNKVFLARFPGRVRLAKVLPYASYLPQLPPIPWVDNDGLLTSKLFGTFSIDMGVAVARIFPQPTSASGHRRTKLALSICDVRYPAESGHSLGQLRRRPLRANRFTSHCKKSSDLSRRQTTMKSATDLPNGDPQNLREMTLR